MTAVNLATADLFHAEIARLQAEIDRLRSQPCPYVTGDTTKHCTLTPLTLTDAEREVITWAANAMRPECRATLRGLLERCTKNGTAG